ncbi:hypothetical protein C7Y72_02265 [Paraconexibacter algicola]|uniref:Low temperature requirement protein A n=1 Tax=Paraconexibacter algicola TaxID=2133960 RepID=A0A2T4UH42_9ACTN|nr:hypothetical protein C7Y72_02265 [Paraconexibacter algicola]
MVRGRPAGPRDHRAARARRGLPARRLRPARRRPRPRGVRAARHPHRVRGRAGPVRVPLRRPGGPAGVGGGVSATGTLLGGRVDGHRPATALELFFDLCFVVAVAQVAAVLHGDPTVEGAATAAGLFVGIWWAWMAVTWHAAAGDRDDAAYRVGILTAMLAVLAVAVGVPDAAAGDATLYALAAGALRVPLVALWLALRRRATSPGLHAFTGRYAAGSAWGAVLWAGSALADGTLQHLLWALALAGEIAAPYLAAAVADRAFYHPGHIVERYGLFTIIVLGESILAVVVGLDAVDLGVEAAAAAVLGFAGAAALWWLYFDHAGAGGLGRSRQAGFLWGYGHLAIWSGVAAFGVGVHLAIEQAGATGALVAAAPGPAGPGAGELPLQPLFLGPALALAALAAIAASSRIAGAERSVRVRAAGAVVLGAGGLAASAFAPVVATAAVVAVLAAVVVTERLARPAGAGG